MRKICLLLAALLAVASLPAQYLIGRLRPADPGGVAAPAALLLSPGALAVPVAADGSFAQALPAGAYTLTASAEGFQRYTRSFRLRAGDTLRLELALQRLPEFGGPQIVITSRRTAADLLDQAESISRLDAGQLASLGPRTTPEALFQTIGVWIQKTSHGGGSPYVRGLTGNQTLLLVDGIRLNNSTFRYGPNQYLNTVDPLALERIEVVRGSGAVQYGSDALGGAVQLFSREPAFSETFQVRGEALGRWMSQDMEETGRVQAEISSSRAAMLAGISYKRFGDLYAGGSLGVQVPSGYTEFNGDFKFRLQAGPRQLLTLAWQGTDQRSVDRYDQVAQRGFQAWMFDPQQRQLAYARLQTRTGKPWLGEIRTTLSRQLSIEGRFSQRVQNPVQTFERDEVDTWGASVEAVSQFSPRWQAVSGIEGYHDLIGSSAYTLDTRDSTRISKRGLYPDGATASSLAVFSLHTWTLERWAFSAGLRGSYFALRVSDAVFGGRRLDPLALVGNASISYRPDAQQRMFLSVQNGFRAPNINDLSSFGAFDSGVEVPAEGLSPERSLTAELGYKQRSSRMRSSLALYYTRLFDLIVRVPATYLGSSTYNGDPVFQKQNAAAAYVYGAEAETELLLGGGFQLRSGLAYAFGQNVTADEPLSRIPPLNGLLVLSYRPDLPVWAELEGRFAGKQDRLSGGDRNDHRISPGGTPGWAVLNVRIGSAVGEWVRITLGFQNLLNEAYRIHGSGVDGYGRSIWATVRVRI
ncbi:MAG: TonB-dependent receptor [Bacteroidia bacterium]|nr:TonB-dependent receptor [Bacteroidia bacterium]